VKEPVQQEILTELIDGDTPDEKAKNLVEKLVSEKVL
jgi:hypothetical protein